VQSLDGKPISESRSLLLSLAARALPREGNRLPFHSEPVAAEVSLLAPAGLKLHRLATSPAVQSGLPTTYREGRYRLSLEAQTRAHWIALR
jgi:hypothetical protein